MVRYSQRTNDFKIKPTAEATTAANTVPLAETSVSCSDVVAVSAAAADDSSAVDVVAGVTALLLLGNVVHEPYCNTEPSGKQTSASCSSSSGGQQ
jgi:hypothetical protein